ncbi:tRNA (adenine(22)-N(1))-methyltransferase [Eremococcus coleocola]|uniref:tRNA (adenine(22)-N(1))-methyltransferase n=1 Tax=Eremococcus coleocola TaxID=88132 RepID=UPI0003FAA546|nr:tRNA (adenine(22)-N(1))-methyltransferase TrmK [Eremococcus coleocola]
MNSQHLSKRLQQVADYIVQHSPKPRRLLDIGSDHAYLLTYLGLAGHIDYGLAGEVVPGPFHSAQQEVAKQGLNSLIDVRLGDGFEVLTLEDKINAVSICGMGGALIAKILERGYQGLRPNHYLFLQANVGQATLRRWLDRHQYEILAEAIIEEAGHIYEVMVAHDNPNYQVGSLSEEAINFGPYLRQEASPVFKRYWQGQAQKTAYIIDSMKQGASQNQTRIAQLEAHLALIEKELANDTQ